MDAKNNEISKNSIFGDLVDELGIKNNIEKIESKSKNESELKLTSVLKNQLSTIMKESSQLSKKEEEDKKKNDNSSNDLVMMKLMELQAAMFELQAQNLKLQGENKESREMIKKIELRVSIIEKLNLGELKSNIKGKISSDILSQAESIINSKLENLISNSSKNSYTDTIIKELVNEVKNLKKEVSYLNEALDSLLRIN